MFFNLCRITAEYYIQSEDINLTRQERVDLKKSVDEAIGPAAAHAAMTETFERVFKATDLAKERFVKPIEDVFNQLASA